MSLKCTRDTNESARQRAPLPSRVLNGRAQPELDAIVELAASICETPIARLTLLDEQRQWTKRGAGIELTQTSRTDAFCADLVNADGVIEVPDARTDPRFRHNPLVTGEPGIRFYAGAPLVNRQGHMLGGLCVIDTHTRALNHKQRDSLKRLAGLVMSLFERHKTRLDRRDQAHDMLERTRRLTTRLVNAEEAERRRIAQDLHDATLQSLLSVRFCLDEASKAANGGLRPILAQATQLTQNVIEQTRTLVFDLSPPVLRDFGLVPALRWLSGRLCDPSSKTLPSCPSYRVTETPHVPQIPHPDAVFVFRAVRELWMNVAKHAQASDVLTTVSHSESLLYITVADNGCGFQRIDTTHEPAGFGLFSIEEQIHGRGGQFLLASRPTGTTVKLAMPISE